MNTTLYHEYKINLFLSDHPFIITLILIAITILLLLVLLCSYVYCVRKNRIDKESKDEKNTIEIELMERSHYVLMNDPK
jgi:uncharacterized membrane protein